ncbi:MAG TPA: anti-sigma factor [Pyrinomonadaceae bacterium]
MRHEEYKELAALDAVGALDAEETRLLGEHLAACAECGREAREWREAAAAIAYAVEPVAPPASLRARVLENARLSETVLPFKRQAREAAGDGPNVVGDGPNAVRQPALRAAAPPAARVGTWRLLASRPPLLFGALAAAVAIVFLAALSLMLGTRNRALAAQVAQLSQSLDRAREETLLAREESVRTNEINNIVTAQGALVAVIDGTEQAPGASARLVMDKRTGRAVLAAHGLPPAPAGKTYQLWYIAGGKPQPGGLFTTDGEGRALLSDRVPEAGLGASLFAVTLEPAGGVQAPTGGMYLRGSAS